MTQNMTIEIFYWIDSYLVLTPFFIIRIYKEKEFFTNLIFDVNDITHILSYAMQNGKF